MRAAVVTGSGRGIGRAIALRLAGEGYAVVINAKRGREEAEETLKMVKNAGGDGAVVMADVGTREGCKSVVRAALENYGGLDVLVNNAGTGLYAPFLEVTDSMIDKQINLDLKSVIYCSQEAARVMGEGVIINVASVAGMRPFYGLAIYSAAKAAVINLTKALALELAPRIRVNAVAPGLVTATKIGDSLLKLLGLDEAQYAERYTLTRKAVRPEDVAEVVWMLIKIPAITGEVVVLDAGESLKPWVRLRHGD